MVGSHYNHPGAPNAATKGEANLARVRVEVERPSIRPDEGAPDVGHSGEESAGEAPAVLSSEGESELGGDDRMLASELVHESSVSREPRESPPGGLAGPERLP